jgi:hypothetical protein
VEASNVSLSVVCVIESEPLQTAEYRQHKSEEGDPIPFNSNPSSYITATDSEYRWNTKERALFTVIGALGLTYSFMAIGSGVYCAGIIAVAISIFILLGWVFV